LHVVKQDFTCHWGTKFAKGDIVVARKRYKKARNSNSTYVLLKNFHVVFLYSHLVQATIFLMVPKDYHVQGNDLVYELSHFANADIMSTLATLEFY
jgi:hypothetical protein